MSSTTLTDEIVAPLDPNITAALGNARNSISFASSFKQNFIRAQLLDELLRCGRIVRDTAKDMVLRAALGRLDLCNTQGQLIIATDERTAWDDAFDDQWCLLQTWIMDGCKEPLPAAGK